ncbi:hypothetical protein EDB92DRAFT_644060 [Lactarius akahatsu]|uniref:Uncharacterized protein n=1 Tax=Lactarius akahatsu TaxID=416441 RepID=A0AAD4LJL7_9AGAM|nr:hypothetical protein EDB92DRAFT_644060 [Lactarius akahatsu]
MANPKFPVEIMDRIVQEVLRSQSRAFSSIAALSVVSRQLRYISLKAYFSHLTLHRLTKAGKFIDIPDSSSWVRHLSTTMQIIEKKALPVFKMNLVSLELACEAVSVFSLSASILLVFPLLPTTLVSLKLTSLPHITSMLLKEIARRCTSLKELELSVVEQLGIDCCWACFEESSTCVKHSPIGFDASCDTAEELATFYARCLQPLGSLQRLSIGVFLSSSIVLKEHIDSHSLAREDCQLAGCPFDDSLSAPHTPGLNGYRELPRVHSYGKLPRRVATQERGTAIGCRPYTPTECATCWEAHGLRTREDELMATMRLAQNLRSLTLVRWSSWFNSPKTTPRYPPLNDKAEKRQSGGAELREVLWAAFEIQRGEGRVKVWRRA